MIEADIVEATTFYIILYVQFGFLEEIYLPSVENSHPSPTLPPSHQRQATREVTKTPQKFLHREQHLLHHGR